MNKEISPKWVYSDFDKTTLTRQARATLDETVRVLKENPDITVELDGYNETQEKLAREARRGQKPT